MCGGGGGGGGDRIQVDLKKIPLVSEKIILCFKFLIDSFHCLRSI